MRSAILTAFLFLAGLSGCQTIGEHNLKDGELIVLGTYENPKYLKPLDDYAVSGLIEADFRIAKVIAGRPPGRVVRVRYIAHAPLTPHASVRLRLRPSDSDDIFLVCRSKGSGFNCD